MADQLDPTSHRIIHTQDGVVGIPREQKGVPIKEYFRNSDMPKDMNRAVIFATEKGPVIAEPDPVAWSQEHNEAAQNYAGRIKELIDDKGYYARVLNKYSDTLARETGQRPEDVKAVIIQSFEHQNQKDPYQYLQQHLERIGKLERQPQQKNSNAQQMER